MFCFLNQYYGQFNWEVRGDHKLFVSAILSDHQITQHVIELARIHLPVEVVDSPLGKGKRLMVTLDQVQSKMSLIPTSWFTRNGIEMEARE